eukprot:7079942-Prymnesium_polylepis.1
MALSLAENGVRCVPSNYTVHGAGHMGHGRAARPWAGPWRRLLAATGMNNAAQASPLHEGERYTTLLLSSTPGTSHLQSVVLRAIAPLRDRMRC